MSLPPAAALPMGSMSAPALLNPIEYFIMNLNTNPYFIGLMMLLLNLGGRFIGMEVSKEQEKVLQQPWIRRALIFTVLFVATRNVLVALIMTVFVLLIVSFLFNENSDLYLFRKDTEKQVAEQQPQSGLTPEETEIWRRLNEKQMRLAPKPAAATEEEEEGQEPVMEEIYAFNLSKLRT